MKKDRFVTIEPTHKPSMRYKGFTAKDNGYGYYGVYDPGKSYMGTVRTRYEFKRIADKFLPSESNRMQNPTKKSILPWLVVGGLVFWCWKSGK